MNIFYTEKNVGKNVTKTDVLKFSEPTPSNLTLIEEEKMVFERSKISLDSVQKTYLKGYKKILILNTLEYDHNSIVVLYKKISNLQLKKNYSRYELIHNSRNVAFALTALSFGVSSILYLGAQDPFVISYNGKSQSNFNQDQENDAVRSLLVPAFFFATTFTLDYFRKKYATKTLIPDYYNFYLRNCPPVTSQN